MSPTDEPRDPGIVTPTEEPGYTTQQPYAYPPQFANAPPPVTNPNGTVSFLGQTYNLNDANAKAAYSTQYLYWLKYSGQQAAQRETQLQQYSNEAWGTQPPVIGQGFWQDPKRVIRYKKEIDAGTAPLWVDSSAVNAAYTYFSNKFPGVTPDNWTVLPKDDPANQILANIPSPEHPDTWDIEADYEEKNPLSQLNTGSWKNLGWAQKAQQLLLNPGTVSGRSQQAETAGTWLSALPQGAMMGLAAMGLTKNPIVGALVGITVYGTEVGRNLRIKNPLEPLKYSEEYPFDFTKAPKIAADYAQFHLYPSRDKWNQMSSTEKQGIFDKINALNTNKNAGAISGYDDVMGVIGKTFNFFSENAERAIGVLEMAVEDKSFASIVDKATRQAAWKASSLTYETGSVGDTLSDITGTLSGKGRTKPGEVWKTAEGIATPVKADFATGTDALIEMRDRIYRGEDAEAVLDEFRNKFGVEGQMNDFALQTIFDPLNSAPVVGAGTVKYVGKAFKLPDVEAAGRLAGWDFKNDPVKSAGRAIADIIPGANILLPLVSGGKINQSTGLLGALNTYRSFLQTNYFDKGVAPAKLSNLEKLFGGLTDEGLLKTVDPGVKVSPFKSLLGWNNWMSQLSPVSKAMMANYNVMDVMTHVMEQADWDFAKFEKMLTAISKADPNQTADIVSKILNPVGEEPIGLDTRFYNSPIAVTAAKSIQAFIDSGGLQRVKDLIDSTATNRGALANFAKIFGLSDTDIIRMIKKGDVDWIKRYEAILDPNRKALMDQMLGDLKIGKDQINEYMKAQTDPFTRKVDPIPYKEELFGRQAAHEFYKSMGDYMAKRFGITKDKDITRVTSLLKSAQSLVLLGLNPRYFLNNELNNIVTRIATGIFGYVKDYDSLVNKARIDLARGDIEANFMTMGDTEGLPKGIGDRNKDAKFQFLEKWKSAGNKVNKKLGIFSRFSSQLESLESKHSTIIAFQDMFTKLHKPKLDPNLKAQLDSVNPKISREIESKAKAGWTVDEIKESLKNDWYLPDEYVNNVAEKYANASVGARVDADLFVDLLQKTGVMEEVTNAFKGIKNPTEVQIKQVLDRVISKRMEYVSKALRENIDTHVEDIKARLATENPSELGTILLEMGLKNQLDRFNNIMDLDSVYSMKGTASKEHFEYLLNTMLHKHDVLFADEALYNKATLDTILTAKGLDKNDPNVKTVLDSFEKIAELNQKFNDAKRKAFSDIQGKYRGDDAGYQTALDKAKAEVERLSNETVAEQMKIQMEADVALFHALGDDPKVAEWKGRVAGLQSELHKMVNDFRQALVDNPPADSIERNALWAQFFMEKYFPKYTEIGYAEVEGAKNTFESQPTLDGIPPNSAPMPTPINTGAEHDLFFQHIEPFLQSLKQEMLNEVNVPRTKFTELSPTLQKNVMGWVDSLKQDMIQAKYASLKYAQTMRDLTMLNYQQKTNFDEALNWVYPYQFWFTNTMRNWMLRSVDKASWFNMYFRYKNMQDNLEKNGLPTRLSGKMALAMPFLPDWMGDTVWFDPMAQIFPFMQIFQPFSNIARKGSDVEHEAVAKIYDMVSQKKITREQAEQIVNSKEGAVWEEAYQAAVSETDKDPMTLASMMMQPAMWIDIPSKLLSGRTSEISPTPSQKTFSALQSQIDTTAGKKSVVGSIVGFPSWLETNIRKAVGMSPAVAKYGQFGDYYIERELANMAFDGRASLDEAQQAMLSHSGAFYDEADASVARQLSIKTPGMLTVEALRGDATAAQMISSFFTSFFPLGLLPQGELKYKNVQYEFNEAWAIYNKTGDKRRVNALYDKYPEYAARTALYEKDPQERMKQYIIGKIWDVYGNSGKADQVAIKNALGQNFVDSFLDKETGDPSLLSLENLMVYARQLNVMYPPKPVGFEMPDDPTVEQVETYSPEINAEYQKFTTARDELYPFYYAYQEDYFAQGGEGDPSKELQEYWDWKKDYVADHPILAPVFESTKNVNTSKYKKVYLGNFDPTLIKQLSNYYTTGEDMTAGAWELLGQEWNELGEPYGDFHKWMERDIRPSITGQ